MTTAVCSDTATNVGIEGRMDRHEYLCLVHWDCVCQSKPRMSCIQMKPLSSLSCSNEAAMRWKWNVCQQILRSPKIRENRSQFTLSLTWRHGALSGLDAHQQQQNISNKGKKTWMRHWTPDYSQSFSVFSKADFTGCFIFSYLAILFHH